MSLLTDQEIHDADPAPHERFDQERIDFARAIEQAVIAKLATVSVEPIGWIRKTKNSRPEDVTVIDIRKEEADEWKTQFIPGFARSEPMYSAEALAAAWMLLTANAESNGGASHPTRTPSYRAGTNDGEQT